MNWLSLVKIFSGPLGNLVNAGIIAGSSAAITWAASKGIDQQTSTAVIGGLVLAAGSIINSLTGTQIVQIQNIREDQTNGVTVVRSSDARKANIPSVNEPNPNAG